MTTKEILYKAQQLVLQRWHKGSDIKVDETGCSVCARGAIGVAAGRLSPLVGDIIHDKAPGYDAALVHFEKVIGDKAPTFNDAVGRTQAEVALALGMAARIAP